MSTLVRPEPSADDLDSLRARVAEREAVLDERAAEADRLKGELDTFAAHYKQMVGTLHQQLDELELDIAELELGELSKRVAEGGGPESATPSSTSSDSSASSDTSDDAGKAEPAARFTSDAVRKLFRNVALTIHPDLAGDDRTRDRRHALMVQANRAYELRDAEQLRKILEAWERSPESVIGSDPAAMRLRMERRLAQIDEDVALYDGAIAELQASSLYELKKMVDDASAKGRDLMADMVRRLKRDIMVATNRLDAMRSVP